MRPADQIERWLDRLEDHTSAAFDELTVRDMFGALDDGLRTAPARSWRDTARAIMSSRITRFAAAAVLAIGVLLLARHLTGRDTVVTPEHENQATAHKPGDEDSRVRTPTVEEVEQLRLAQERTVAQELFAKSDTQGLLRLLDTGLDQTKITVAGYLGQIGDQSALPALQRLANQWQGSAEENPFLKSIEQIRSVSPKPDKTGPEGQSQEQKPPDGTAVALNGPHIVIRVTEKATGEPIPQATVRVVADNKDRTYAADEQGVFILDLSASTLAYIRISVPQEGYVWQAVTLKGLKKENLPKTIQFSLEKGVVIGAIVQDSDGRPIEGVTVESYISEEQRFDQPAVSVRITETTDAKGRWRSANVPREIGRLWFNVRHPDFAAGGFEMPRNLKFEDLRAERAVMVLDKGIAVTGRVIDMAGKPVAGAKLLAGEDYFARDWTQTDAAGHFEFQHLRPLNQSFLLTVQAPGFAPQRRDLPSEKGLAPADFVLEPAKVLIGRVVDAAGKPIVDAYVGSEEWNDYRTVKWQANTDAKGVFVWDYPPADAIRIRIGKSGYREILRDVIANDQEQTFVMTRPMTIKGSVTDSETGQMVSRFKLTPGAHWNAGDRRAIWQTSESWVKWFTDGRYSYTFSGDARAYAVRIEADGYTPAESRFVDANEQEVTIDIALAKGQGPSGYVFDANAVPVAGAEVFWERELWIQNGQTTNKMHRVYVKTDNDGHFTFKPEDRRDPLVAIGDRGVGMASYEDFARDGVITLTPWARVQGELRIGTQPAANQRLQLMGQRLPEAVRLSGDETTTDGDGRFVFEKVYPGQYRLYNQTYEVLPGQTLELHLGGTGRTVRGELLLPVPSDVPIWASLSLVTLRAPVPLDKLPKPAGYEQMSFGQVQLWLERFGQSPEGKAYSAWLEKTYPQSTRSLRIEMDDRRTFHVDNVEPGTYMLLGDIYHSGLGGTGGYKVIGRLWHQFEIPPFANDTELDTPLDLGTVAVLPGELKPGDPAPDFDVPASGQGRVRLADYRGKVVLVTFLSWNFMAPDSAAVQELRGVYQRFREDPHYAQIGLQFAAQPLLDKKAAEEAGLEWPQGLLEGQQRKEAVEYDVKAAPWNVLIGPQGEIVAVGVPTEALPQAIEKALSALR